MQVQPIDYFALWGPLDFGGTPCIQVAQNGRAPESLYSAESLHHCKPDHKSCSSWGMITDNRKWQSKGDSQALRMRKTTRHSQRSLLWRANEDRMRGENAFSSAFVRYLGGELLLPYFLRYMCPHPILVSDNFMVTLKGFHVALSAALTDIVQRWVIDEAADLSSRMPLEPHEDSLLRV